jgi:hypothetical protein
MKILKFNESNKNSDLSIIKDYFVYFIDEMDNDCIINFTKMSDNYFEVTIKFKEVSKLNIEKENDLNRIDSWMKNNSLDNNILKVLKSSMQMLMSDDILEDFELQKYPSGYAIKIHTKIREDKISDWVYVQDYSIYYDKNRFKKIIKDKFDVDVESSYMREEYDKNNERFLEFVIIFTEKISAEIAKKILKYILDIRITEGIEHNLYASDEEEVFIRSRGLTPYQKDTKNLFFEINYAFTDLK